jgi:hypothetical protein
MASQNDVYMESNSVTSQTNINSSISPIGELQ